MATIVNLSNPTEAITVTLGGGTEEEIVVRLNELAKGRDGYDATVGGANGQVQYNSGDEFAGSSGMTYDEGSETFTATNISGTNATFTDATISSDLTTGTVTATTGSFTDASVSGTLTADHIHGNLAGSLYTHIRAGENLSKGDPVYISGYHAGTDRPIVMRADSASSATMPSIGIMDAAVANNESGHVVISGTITDINTNAYSVNQNLYVASGGGLTGTKPSANAQPVAIVERVNTNTGAIIVTPSTTFSNISITASQISDSTDIGRSLIELANPDAITFPRFNADNTTTARSASDFRADIAAVGLSGNETVAGNKTLSGQLELTGQSATNATSALTRGIGDGRYDLLSTIIVPSQDTTFTSDTTLKDVGLRVTLPSGRYEIIAVIASSSAGGSTGGLKTALTVVSGTVAGSTSGAANENRGIVTISRIAVTAFVQSRTNIFATMVGAGGSGGQSWASFVHGCINVTAEAVLSFYAAQNASSADVTTIRSDSSYMLIRPLPSATSVSPI